MKVKTFEFNPLAVNTYVVSDETKECVVIDPACYYPDERETLLNYILDNDLHVRHIINTHLHFDHIFGVNFIASQFDVKLQAHQDDEFLIADLPDQLKMFGFPSNADFKPEIGNYLTENNVISFGNQEFKILHVPGHSPGSLCFYNEKTPCVFVGDVLFNSSIGRTDLPGGNFEQLISGIKTKLFTLPEETAVYSGHGPITTIGSEKVHNPFFESEI